MSTTQQFNPDIPGDNPIERKAELQVKIRCYQGHIGGSWRIDETYIKVCGEWVYLFRAIDSRGRTIDFYLSQRRNAGGSCGRCVVLCRARGHRAPRLHIPSGWYLCPHHCSFSVPLDGAHVDFSWPGWFETATFALAILAGSIAVAWATRGDPMERYALPFLAPGVIVFIAFAIRQ